MSVHPPVASTVDAALAIHPDVASWTLVRDGERTVLAVVPQQHCLAVDLRDHLWDSLPAAQLPSAVVVVAEPPAAGQSPDDLLEAVGGCGFDDPATPTEQGVATIWRDVLGRGRVASGDNFLDLGGDSMSATLLLDSLNERFSVELTFDELLLLPSLRAVAETIDARR